MERRADRTKYARHAKTLGSCGAALVFALVVLGDGCGPDYSRSHGSDGTLPPKMPAVPDTLTEWVMTPPESSLAKCSTPFQFSVRVEQAVPNCEAADFRLLYERALALAQSRIAHYTCPKGCGPAYAWILSQSWDCDVPVGETRTRAAANVGYGVTCPAAPEDKDSGLLPSPAKAFRGPYENVRDGADIAVFAPEMLFATPASPCTPKYTRLRTAWDWRGRAFLDVWVTGKIECVP